MIIKYRLILLRGREVGPRVARIKVQQRPKKHGWVCLNSTKKLGRTLQLKLTSESRRGCNTNLKATLATTTKLMTHWRIFVSGFHCTWCTRPFLAGKEGTTTSFHSGPWKSTEIGSNGGLEYFYYSLCTKYHSKDYLEMDKLPLM